MRATIALSIVLVATLTGVAGGYVYDTGYLEQFTATEEQGLTIGEYGSAHDHLYMKMELLNRSINFSRDRFQLQSDFVHFENRNGEILHVHATGVSLKYALATLGFEANRSCITFNTTLCSNSTHVFKVWNDGEPIDSLATYELGQDDNILLWYGHRNATVDGGFFRKELPPRYRPSKPGSMV